MAVAQGLGIHRDRAGRGGRRGREAVLAGVGRLDHLPHPRPRRRPVRTAASGWPESPSTMRWAAPGRVVDQDPHRIDQHRGVLSFVLTPGQAGDSPEMIPVLYGIKVARTAGGRPDPTDTSWPTRRTPPAGTGPGYAPTGSARPSLSRPTTAATAGTRAPAAGDPTRSTRRGTRTGTPSSAASTSSNTTAGSPPATTSSPSGSPPRSVSRSSTTGYGAVRNRP